MKLRDPFLRSARFRNQLGEILQGSTTTTTLGVATVVASTRIPNLSATFPQSRPVKVVPNTVQIHPQFLQLSGPNFPPLQHLTLRNPILPRRRRWRRTPLTSAIVDIDKRWLQSIRRRFLERRVTVVAIAAGGGGADVVAADCGFEFAVSLDLFGHGGATAR